MAFPSSKVIIKLFVNKASNRVAFVDAGGDFVDILFRFLLMPMGTILRLLNKSSQLHCMENLYRSVNETLGRSVFVSEAARTALLQPSNASDHFLRFYAFVKQSSRFLISDDMLVSISSTSQVLTLLEKLGVVKGDLEEKKVEVGRQEIVHLLQRALVSDTAMTDVFLKGSNSSNSAASPRVSKANPLWEVARVLNPGSMDKSVEVKLLVDTDFNRVIYAESKDGSFAELLLLFLTFPLGSTVRILGGKSSLTCVDNLYWSAQSIIGSPIEQFPCALLLDPKKDGWFLKSAPLLVMDDLTVQAFDLTSCFNHLRIHTVGSNGRRILTERTVVVGRAEALAILKSCLVSEAPLSDVLLKPNVSFVYWIRVIYYVFSATYQYCAELFRKIPPYFQFLRLKDTWVLIRFLIGSRCS